MVLRGLAYRTQQTCIESVAKPMLTQVGPQQQIDRSKQVRKMVPVKPLRVAFSIAENAL